MLILYLITALQGLMMLNVGIHADLYFGCISLCPQSYCRSNQGTCQASSDGKRPDFGPTQSMGRSACTKTGLHALERSYMRLSVRFFACS